MTDVSKVGKRGTIVIPARLRHRFGIEEGTLVLFEESADGVVVRPATVLPIETYSNERRASFLLENAVDEDDYTRARAAVREMGVDPDSIEHERPT